MNTIDTGGPAFPSAKEDKYGESEFKGMDLRDYFAAKAMQAFITSPFAPQEWARDLCAKSAYTMADKMIAERKKAGE